MSPSAVAVPSGYRGSLHQALAALASEGYRAAGRFAHGFARGKLGRDPLFIDMLRHNVFPAEGRFLDLGCGQAVFAAWLLAAQEMAAAGQWPAGWPLPPRVTRLLGLERMPSDVARAHAALARFAPRVTIRQGDVTREEFPPCEVVTLLDVLHYIDHERQRDVLTRAHRALAAGAPGGVLVARVGDASAGWRFKLGGKVDQLVTLARGCGWSDLYCRPLGQWRALLHEIGFDVQEFATESGPPFANTLLIARPRNPRGPDEE